MNQIIQTMIEQINQRPRNEMLPILKALNASDILYDEKRNQIQFRVRGDKGINKVVVTLTAKDLYDVEFWNCQIVEQDPYIIKEKKDTVKDLYAENLCQTIWEGVVIV